MQVPTACSLKNTEALAQLDEWHELLSDSVAATERVSPTDLALHLEKDFDQLSALVRLAQREKACCAFFDFTIFIDVEDVVLRVAVPPEATMVLDDFARLGS